jgi:hypothetical protein
VQSVAPVVLPSVAAPPTSAYTLTNPTGTKITLAGEDGGAYTGLDLDIPKSKGRDGHDTDIKYMVSSATLGARGELSLDGGLSLGNAEKTPPGTAEECKAVAETQAVGELWAKDLKVGQAFCVVTDKNNVAWLQLMGKGSGAESPDLKFNLLLWKAG